MRSKYATFGQGIIEYTLILFFIAIVVIIIFKGFCPFLGSVFSRINTQLAVS